jgi:capsular exopolysaccharide synthesis family protein
MEREEKESKNTEAGQQSITGVITSHEAFHHYRGLIGQLELALADHSSKVVLFSSSLQGEGTTEVVVGLALAISAGTGRRTAILDCNMVNPDLHRRFGTPRKGLNEVLSGNLPLEKALVNTTVPNLYVMPIGEHFSSFSVYDKDDIARTIEELRKRFDYVLIDSAPVGTTPEATVLIDKVDAVVMVVRHGRTRLEVAKRTKEIVERAGGRMLGVVLNRRKFPIPGFLYRRL